MDGRSRVMDGVHVAWIVIHASWMSVQLSWTPIHASSTDVPVKIPLQRYTKRTNVLLQNLLHRVIARRIIRATFCIPVSTLQKEISQMANNTKPLQPSIFAADRDSLAALKNIPAYSPANPAYATTALVALQSDADAKETAAAQAEAESKAKRDDAVAAKHAFHNGVVGMRDSVGAQFGKDSNEFQAVGRKKTTEYKKPVRKPKAATAQAGQK